MNHFNFDASSDFELRSGNPGLSATAGQTMADSTALAIVSDPLLGQSIPTAQASQAPRTEIVFIENNVGDIEVLRAGIGAGKEVYVLDASQNGLQQIAEVLAGRTGIDALHLVSHGSEASVNLGSLLLDPSSLASHQEVLQRIGKSLGKDADVLLYGCNLARSDQGKTFIQELGIATGADIAASTNATGATQLGGDWVLEFQGQEGGASIETQSIVASDFSEILGLSNQTVTFVTNTSFVSSGWPGLFSGKTTSSSYDVVYKVAANAAYQLKVDGSTTGVTRYSGAAYVLLDGNGNDGVSQQAVTFSFVSGNTFTPTQLYIQTYAGDNPAQTLQFKGYDSGNSQVGSTVTVNLGATGSNTVGPSTKVSFTDLTNIDHLVLKATTNGGAIIFPAVKDISLSVNSLVVSPTITSSATANFAENTSTSTTAYDADATGSATITYAFDSGTDDALFDINSSTGEVTFKTSPNFEIPSDSGGNNVYDIKVKATNGGGSASKDIAITVTNVNEAPTITNLDTDSSSFVVGTSEYIDNQTSSSPVSVLDVDSTDFNGGYILISRTSGTADGSFSSDLGTDSALKFGTDGTIVAGETVYVDTANGGSYIAVGTVDATHHGQNGANLKIALNASSSPLVAETIIKFLKFSAPSFGGRAYSVVVNDGDGGTSTTSNFTMTAIVDTDSSVTASAVVIEPIALDSTKDTVGEAVNVFDFTVNDAGTADGLPTALTQIALSTSGTGDFSKVVWRLSGGDIGAPVSGSYSSVSNTITFASLTESIENASSQVYTVSAYYTSSSVLTEGQTYTLSVDGDSTTNFTVSTTGSQMASGQSAVNNSSGTKVSVEATELRFTTQPSATTTSGSTFATQPVVKATDAFGNVDTDFSGTVTLTQGGSGTLSDGDASVTQNASAGVATFSGVLYTAASDADADFTLSAAATGLSNATSSSINPDVVATKLAFGTQPAPTTLQSGQATSFSTVPVVQAVDAANTVEPLAKVPEQREFPRNY